MSLYIFNKKYDINLQELSLQNNQLSSLPAKIGKLINLQKLHLHNNKLRSLPAEIDRLINLKELLLDNNQLRRLPRALALRGCFAVLLKLFR